MNDACWWMRDARWIMYDAVMYAEWVSVGKIYVYLL